MDVQCFPLTSFTNACSSCRGLVEGSYMRKGDEFRRQEPERKAHEDQQRALDMGPPVSRWKQKSFSASAGLPIDVCHVS